MTRGRKPTPLAIHKLNGNPSKLKDIDRRSPKATPLEPDRPAWLTGEARKMWDGLVPELLRMGVLTVLDGYSLAAACQEYSTWLKCQKILKKEGETYEYTNKNGSSNTITRPEVGVANKALAQYRAFMAEFGLSPSSRTRLEMAPDDQMDDELEKLLSGVR